MINEFIGIGDLHLTDSNNKGGLAAYIADHDAMVARAVNKVLRYATKNGVEHIFLYGDICCSPRMSYKAMAALISILRQDFQFHIILGNHDIFGSDPTAGHSLEIIKEVFPDVHIYEKPTTKGNVKFLPYPSTDFDSTLLNVAHVDVAGSKSDSGRSMSGIKTTATAVIGHIHTHQRVRNCHYSGTLYQTYFGEKSDKFFHHGTFQKGAWEIESVPFQPEYRLHTVEALVPDDLKKVPASDKDLIKLVLLPNNTLVPADYSHLNVVTHRAVGSKKELELARIEDNGAEVKISSAEFFKEWLKNSRADSELKKQAWRLRKELIAS